MPAAATHSTRATAVSRRIIRRRRSIFRVTRRRRRTSRRGADWEGRGPRRPAAVRLLRRPGPPGGKLHQVVPPIGPGRMLIEKAVLHPLLPGGRRGGALSGLPLLGARAGRSGPMACVSAFWLACRSASFPFGSKSNPVCIFTVVLHSSSRFLHQMLQLGHDPVQAVIHRQGARVPAHPGQGIFFCQAAGPPQTPASRRSDPFPR